MKLPFKKYLIFLTVLKGIFVVSLMLSIILWSFPIFSLNSGLWSLFQERSGVIVSDNVTNYNDLFARFFISGLGLESLSESELSHMQDVREIILIVNILFLFSFISLISGFSYLSRSQKRFLLNATRKTSLATFGVTLVLSFLIILNFNFAFLSFHELFFVQNFVFPATGILKTLYPDQFFRDLTAVYLISIMVVSLAVAGMSYRTKLK